MSRTKKDRPYRLRTEKEKFAWWRAWIRKDWLSRVRLCDAKINDKVKDADNETLA